MSFDALMSQAQSLIDVGRHREALAHFDRALELEPASALAWFSRGYACTALGETDDAARCYLESARRRPDHPITWLNLGTALHELGRFEQALDCFEIVLRLDAGIHAGWFGKARALVGLERHADALHAARAFLAHAGDDDPLVPAARRMVQVLTR